MFTNLNPIIDYLDEKKCVTVQQDGSTFFPFRVVNLGEGGVRVRVIIGLE